MQSRLKAAEEMAGSDSVEDLLEEQTNIQEQLERLPSICRYQYEAVGQYFLSLFDPALQQYKVYLASCAVFYNVIWDTGFFTYTNYG